MSTGVQQACCGIWNKGACREVKDSAIAIAAALSVIALLGSILIVLASQGVPMGPLNALVAPVTPQIMYTMLIASTFATLITVTLLALLVRSYLNKQVSVKELENRRGADGEGKNIFEVIRDRYIPEKLLPGHCWKLDFEGVRGKYPMTYAVIVKNSKGEAGVLAFNSEADRKSYIERTGYRDGIKAFRDGNEIPAAYIDAKYGDEFLAKFEAAEDQDIVLNELKAGEQVVFEDVDTLEEGVSTFVLVTKKLQGMEVRYFRSEEACMDALEEPQYAHYLLHADLEAALSKANDEKLMKYNRFNEQLALDETKEEAFWVAPFKVSKGRQNVTVHILSYKNNFDEDASIDYFLSSTELQDFIDRELDGYEDISEEAADTIASYSKSKVESKGSESEGSESETESDTSTEGSRFRAATNRQKFLEDAQFYYTDTENNHSGTSSQSPSDSEDDRSATPIPSARKDARGSDKASSIVESRKKTPITSDAEESESSSSDFESEDEDKGYPLASTSSTRKDSGASNKGSRIEHREKTSPSVSDTDESESSDSESSSSSSSSEESEKEKETDSTSEARALAEAEEKKKAVEAEVNGRANAFVEANHLETLLGANQCYLFEEKDSEGTIHYYSVARSMGNEWIKGHFTTLEERARETAAFTKVHEEMANGHFPIEGKIDTVLKTPLSAEVNQSLAIFKHKLISNDYVCHPAVPTNMQKFPLAFPLVYRRDGAPERWEYFTSAEARDTFIKAKLAGLNSLNERYNAAKHIGEIAFAKIAEKGTVPLALYIPASDLFAADRQSPTKQFFLMKSDRTTTIITVTAGEGEDPVDKFKAEAKIEAELLMEELWKPHYVVKLKSTIEEELGNEKGRLNPREFAWYKWDPKGEPVYRALFIRHDDVETEKNVETEVYFDLALAQAHADRLTSSNPKYTKNNKI